jgi:hypothetical protein
VAEFGDGLQITKLPQAAMIFVNQTCTETIDVWNKQSTVNDNEVVNNCTVVAKRQHCLERNAKRVHGVSIDNF